MLIECPECKKQISDQAKSCPHCGYPIKGNQDETEQKPNNPHKTDSVSTMIAISFFRAPRDLNKPISFVLW